MKITSRTLLVVLAAVLGIVLAAAVTWGTSQLVRQHIGLASEPLTAGHGLLPSATPSTGRSTTTIPPSTTPPATSPSQTTTTVVPPSDGGDSGRGDD